MLCFEFAIQDLGPLHHFSGNSVTRNSSGLFLSQPSMPLRLLSKVVYHHVNPVQVRWTTKPNLVHTPTHAYDDPSLYHSLAGALQYLTLTIPNI